MTCHRCGGLMLAERYDDLYDYTEQAEFTGWRCVNCGTVLDPVIRANRHQSLGRTVQWI
jgi:uncharacterized OB-fold protein